MELVQSFETTIQSGTLKPKSMDFGFFLLLTWVDPGISLMPTRRPLF